jgi:16S rRNA processing protein RimM
MFEFKAIGQILKPYKHSGELLAKIEPSVFKDLEKCEALFIRIDGIEVPFFIEDIELDPDVSYLKLEEFNAPEDIKPFNGKELFLRLCDLSHPEKLEGQDKIFDQLDGFQLQDINTEKTFDILRTEEYPQQWMAVVLSNGQEALVPLTEAWIIDIDAEAKKISMELPEGLV